MAVEHEVTCPECGSFFRLRGRNKPRSSLQHGRFFGLIAAAFKNWPERAEFQPRDAEHLRAWLLKEAGHCQVAQTIRCETTDPVRLTAILRAGFQAAKAHAFVEADDLLVRVIVPHSVAFDKLPHAAACTIMGLVDGIIETETGLRPEQLLPTRVKKAHKKTARRTSRPSEDHMHLQPAGIDDRDRDGGQHADRCSISSAESPRRISDDRPPPTSPRRHGETATQIHEGMT